MKNLTKLIDKIKASTNKHAQVINVLENGMSDNIKDLDVYSKLDFYIKASYQNQKGMVNLLKYVKSRKRKVKNDSRIRKLEGS